MEDGLRPKKQEDDEPSKYVRHVHTPEVRMKERNGFLCEKYECGGLKERNKHNLDRKGDRIQAGHCVIVCSRSEGTSARGGRYTLCMSDNKLPDYSSDGETFGRKTVWPHAVQLQMDMITRKIHQVHTLPQLKNLTDDIQHSIISSKPLAKAEMKLLVNRRAREMGFKPQHGEHFWQ